MQESDKLSAVHEAIAFYNEQRAACSFAAQSRDQLVQFPWSKRIRRDHSLLFNLYIVHHHLGAFVANPCILKGKIGLPVVWEQKFIYGETIGEWSTSVFWRDSFVRLHQEVMCYRGKLAAK